MKIYRSINEFSPDFKPVVMLGTFDGVHIGHQYILQKLMQCSLKESGQSVLLTFFPHPRYVIHPDNQDLKLINTPKEKEKRLRNIGVQHLIIEKFTKRFSRIKSVNFVRDILVNQLRIHHLIIGHDHHFGRNREGSFQELNKLSELYNFGITRISAQELDSISISSTKIRNALKNGNLELANKYLGYNFYFSGKVIKGFSMGKKLGFPTANLMIEDSSKIIPDDGVYAVKVSFLTKNHFGMLNIGINPTLPKKGRSIEVHIFDFQSDIYDEELTIEMISKIRNEKKFKNLNNLQKQLSIDENRARSILRINT